MSIIEHISHPAINALGWTILHSLWQILLIAMLWKLGMAIARKSAATLRYKLTLMAFLAIPVCFGYTFFRQFNVYQNARQIMSLEFETYAWIASSGTRAFYVLEKGQPAFLAGFEAFTPLVFWVYFAGLLALSIHGFFSYSRIYRLRKKHTKALNREWQQKVDHLIKKAGVKLHVPVKRTEKVDVPVVIGFLKPMILLPAAMLLSMTTEHIETIILHELYHIRRKDHYVNALQRLLENLFFYHPATWLISNHLRKLREQCVDERVVRETGSPLIYAQALVSLEEKRSVALPQSMVAATQSKNQLFTRIKHMMTMKTRSMNTGQKLAALLAIIFAFVSVAWINPAMTVNLFDDADTVLPDQRDVATPYNVTALAAEEEAPGPPPPPSPPPPPPPPDESNGKPHTIYLHDGTRISFEGLDEADREKLLKAFDEIRLAMTEVNKEVFDKLRSESFRMEMQQAGEEARKAGEEVRKAMEELQ